MYEMLALILIAIKIFSFLYQPEFLLHSYTLEHTPAFFSFTKNFLKKNYFRFYSILKFVNLLVNITFYDMWCHNQTLNVFL